MVGDVAGDPGEPGAIRGDLALLEGAITYALDGLTSVTREAMHLPTPCGQWDLTALLAHLGDSLGVLHEAVATSGIELDRSDGGGVPDDPVATLRRRARDLRAVLSTADGAGVIAVSGCPLTVGAVVRVGALEVAVHGWDVAESCGTGRDMPVALAEELLAVAPLLVTDADRPARFGEIVRAEPGADAERRLVAFLGRDPDIPRSGPPVGW